MSKRDKDEDAVVKHMLDRQLDRELEDTFPASDAPKITRTPQHEAAALQDVDLRDADLQDAERDRQPAAK